MTLALLAIFVVIKAVEYTIISIGKSERFISYKGKTYSMHGDPFEVIRGAKLNEESIFTRDDDLSSWQGFRLITDIEFNEYTQYTPKGSEAHDAKAKQKTSDRHLEDLIEEAYSFARIPESEDLEYSSKDGLKLKFKNNSGKLDLIAVDGNSVTPLHYSINDEKDLFSILFWSFDELRGKTIRTLVFAKSQESKSKLSKSFDSFVSGRELLKLKNNNIKLSFCSEVEKEEEAKLIKSFNDWQLESFDVSLKIEKPSEFPPFSDVNINCLILLRKYIPATEFTVWSVGFVPVSVDRAGGRLLASDIFLDMSNLDEEDGLYPTATHELGHFLGLGHDFKNVKSIMNYKDQIHVSKKDYAALGELYEISHEKLADIEPNYAGFYANTESKNFAKLIMFFGSAFLISLCLLLHRFPKWCSNQPPTWKLFFSIMGGLLGFGHLLLLIDFLSLR